MDPLPPASSRSRAVEGLTRGGTHWLLVGSIVGGLGAYGFQVIGTRALGEDAYAPIGTLWTIQYLCWSVVLYSIETYVNREVVFGRVGRRMAVPVILRTGGWIAFVALMLTATTWLVRERLFYGVGDFAFVAGLIAIGYGMFAVVRGRFAGAGRFRSYGVVTAAESVVRLALAAVLALTAATARSLGWIMPVGAFAAAVWWMLVRHRPVEPAEIPDARPSASTGRFLAITTATNSGVQLLLAGAPLVMVALAAAPAEVSMVFVTMTSARVPVVLALGGLLSRMLPTFVRVLEERGDSAGAGIADRIALGTLACAAAGSAGGAIAGPPIIALFFGSGFEPPWWFAAATGAGVLLATGGMLLNQLLIARHLEHRLPVPWFLGLAAASVVVAVTQGTPVARVAAGFIVGEVVAVISLAVAARIRRRGR